MDIEQLIANMPVVVVDKFGITTTVGNIVTQPMSFKAWYGLSTGLANLSIVVANSQYLAY